VTPSAPSSAPTPAAAVVVVNYAASRMIRENLAPFPAGDAGMLVVVVDNHSSDEERTAVRVLCAERRWTLVEQPNAGFGAGMNAGASRALELGASALVLLNPDAVADHGTLRELAHRVDRERALLLGPTIMRSDGTVWFAGGRVLVAEGRTTTRPGTDSASPDGWLTGACLAMHADLWATVGGFDDDYFLYWEDVDLSRRAVDAGFRLEVAHDLTIVHDAGGTQEGAGKSPVYCRYNCRNRLLFAARHLAPRDRVRWLLGSPGYARAVVYRGGRRAFLRDAGRLAGAAILGTLEGTAILIASLLRPRPRRSRADR
jgi:N-acetylglucosaminyl-diphospho-decaprenol L-rhamnosyltransferase